MVMTHHFLYSALLLLLVWSSTCKYAYSRLENKQNNEN